MQNIRKRYASDCSSSNLKDDERNHNTDTLHAVALGADEFGAMLLRAKHAKWLSGRLRDDWRERVAKKAKHKGWSNVAEEVADISLWHFMDDNICEVCHGRGSATIVGSPVLSDVVCGACTGTGKKPFTFDTEIKAFILESISRLNSIERAAASAASQKIGE